MVDFTALPGSLDLFELLVNYVAGGVFLSIIIWAIVILITGIMGRLSMNSILIIIMTFLGVALVGYIGALASVPLMIVALGYMISGIIRRLNQIG